MIFTLSRRTEFARLCNVMLRGEALALRCAERQARLARGHALRRKLDAQRRHEQLHVASFQSVLVFLPRCRGIEQDQAMRLLDAYESKLDDALRRGDLIESLLGLQVVLEGTAAAVLSRLDLSVQSGNAPLNPTRCLLLAQEEGHRALGERAVMSVLMDDAAVHRLRHVAQDYADLASEILEACSAPLASFGIDPATYDPRVALPAALGPNPPASPGAA